MGFGGALGFVTGFALKQFGRLLFVVLGSFIVGVQSMAWQEWIFVDWEKIKGEAVPVLSSLTYDNTLAQLGSNMPFASAFVAASVASLCIS